MMQRPNSSMPENLESDEHQTDDAMPYEHPTIKKIHLPEDKEYHLFLSHSSEDEPQVRKLLELLESPPYNLSCCIDSRDFMLGESIMNNINYAFNKSVGTVVFLSPNFIASSYCNHEKQTAYSLFMAGQGRVIPVVLEPCTVPDEFRTLHYIDESIPEKIVEKIHRCLAADPKDLRLDLPLEVIQAGTQRQNGNKFLLIRDSSSNELTLNPFLKSKCESLGIEVTESFEMLLEMLNSLPINKPYYQKKIKTYLLLVSYLRALLLVNTALVVIMGQGTFDQSYNTFMYFFGPIVLLPFGHLILWMVIFFANILIKLLHKNRSHSNLTKINQLSISDCNCLFSLQVGVFSKPVYSLIKYDIINCQEHIERAIQEKYGLTDIKIKMFWNKLIKSKLWTTYFQILSLDTLPYRKGQTRHVVLQEKVCFCQYLDLHMSEVNDILKSKDIRTETGQPLDDDRTELLNVVC